VTVSFSIRILLHGVSSVQCDSDKTPVLENSLLFYWSLNQETADVPSDTRKGTVRLAPVSRESPPAGQKGTGTDGVLVTWRLYENEVRT